MRTVHHQLRQTAAAIAVVMFIAAGCGGSRNIAGSGGGGALAGRKAGEDGGKFTEQKAIDMVADLPEVKNDGNLSVISGGLADTDDGSLCYSIQAGNNMGDHFSVVYHFRVYAKPKVEIRYFDIMEYEEKSLDEWRQERAKN
jgi:hypothetical protein